MWLHYANWFPSDLILAWLFLCVCKSFSFCWFNNLAVHYRFFADYFLLLFVPFQETVGWRQGKGILLFITSKFIDSKWFHLMLTLYQCKRTTFRCISMGMTYGPTFFSIRLMESSFTIYNYVLFLMNYDEALNQN